MVLFVDLLSAVLNGILVAVDVALFFIVVRVINRRWPTKRLSALDRWAAPVVEGLLQIVDRLERNFGLSRRLSTTGKLVLLWVVLTLVRFGIASLFTRN